jgi:hypothetical protein
MEYDEMTEEEYENQISDKAEFDYDCAREEKLISQHEQKQLIGEGEK